MSEHGQAIPISEIFGPTIQGEGSLIGTPTVFVRTGGCDFRCSWCDTLYAVDKKFRRQWTPTSTPDVLRKIRELSNDKPLLVTLSGGNPAMQPLGDLIESGQSLGYTFALETQGSIAQNWFCKLDVLTLSPKPPSSKMAFNADDLNNCIKAAGTKPSITLKIVIDGEEDLQWANERRQTYPDLPLVLQPCNKTSGDDLIDTAALNEKMRWLVDTVNQNHWYNVRVLPQLHVQLWGNERGV